MHLSMKAVTVSTDLEEGKRRETHPCCSYFHALCECAVICYFSVTFVWRFFKRDVDRFLTSVGGNRLSATNGLSVQKSCLQIENWEKCASYSTDLQSGESGRLGGMDRQSSGPLTNIPVANRDYGGEEHRRWIGYRWFRGGESRKTHALLGLRLESGLWISCIPRRWGS